MVLIVKKFVKIFPAYEDVPRKYKNLKKNKHVKTFSRPFANIPEILVAEYDLKWDEIIVVFHTKTVDNYRGWRNYRTPFKKIYSGTVKNFGQYLKDFMAEVAKRREKKKKRDDETLRST